MTFAYSFSSVTRPPQYQVFINFRGAELRKGFLKTLVKALKDEQVNVYVDTDEVRGEPIEILFERIAESRIAVTIFSEMYSSSGWCLDELVTIKECMEGGNLRVFPIFYNVKTNDVKNLRGKFGNNFRELVDKHLHEAKKSANWETALKCVSTKIGFSADLRYLTECRYFFYRYWYKKKIAKSIAEEVKKMLTHISMKEEEYVRQIRERDELAEANRNSMSGKIEAMIIYVLPRGVLVFLIVMLAAPYILLLICGILYFTGSFDNQSKLNGRWVNDDRVVIL